MKSGRLRDLARFLLFRWGNGGPGDGAAATTTAEAGDPQVTPDNSLSILASFLGGLMCAELVQHFSRWLRGRQSGAARAVPAPVPVSYNSQPRFRALDPEARS